MWSQEYSNPHNTDILYNIVINDINFIHRNLVNDEGIPHCVFLITIIPYVTQEIAESYS